MNTSAESTLLVERQRSIAGSAAAWSIYLDEQYIGKIGNGEKMHIEISAGHHVIYIKTSKAFGMQSDILKFDVAKGDVRELACGIYGTFYSRIFLRYKLGNTNPSPDLIQSNPRVLSNRLFKYAIAFILMPTFAFIIFDHLPSPEYRDVRHSISSSDSILDSNKYELNEGEELNWYVPEARGCVSKSEHQAYDVGFGLVETSNPYKESKLSECFRQGHVDGEGNKQSAESTLKLLH